MINYIKSSFTGLENSVLIDFEKKRYGQRDVELNIANDVDSLKGRDVFIDIFLRLFKTGQYYCSKTNTWCTIMYS